MLHVLGQVEATTPSLSDQIGFDIRREFDGHGHMWKLQLPLHP
jgi:hypothetical protein